MENLGLKKGKDEHLKKKRQEHTELIQNENYWDLLYTAIALNVDITIFKLEKEDINGDMETYETKNKTDKGFIEFLYQFRSPVSTKRNQYLSNPSRSQRRYV